MTLSHKNKILFTISLLSFLFSGCDNIVKVKTLTSEKAITAPAPLLSQIEIVSDLDTSQDTYTNLSPGLTLRFKDSFGANIAPPADLAIELLGAGELTTGSFTDNYNGTYSLNGMTTTTMATGSMIKVSQGNIEAMSVPFDTATRVVPFTLSSPTNTIDNNSIVFENTYTVNNITELRALVYKKMDTNGDGVIGAGDAYRWVALPSSTKVIFANGDWSNVGRIYLGGNGSPGRPIVFESQSLGGANFKSSTEIYLFGNYVSMRNFSFTGIKPPITAGTPNTIAQQTIAIGRTTKSNSISLDGQTIPAGGTPLACNHCAFRFNKINNSALSFDPLQTNPFEEYDDIWTHGYANEITNNTHIGRNHPGHFIIVWRTNGVEDHHLIAKNEFLDQVYANGANGNESIRIGTGADTTTSSKTIVEHNLFDNVDGEIETVSIKSWDNIIRFNTFRNNKGSVCLRSAGRNLVEGNYILGMNKGGSGGIRAINESNLIVGNHIQDTNPGSVGDMSKNSGIVLPMGTDNPSANYYYPVKDTKIAFNSFSNNKLTLNLGSDAYSVITNDIIDPVNVSIANNVIKGRTNEPYVDRYSPFNSFLFLNNFAAGGLMNSTRTVLEDMTTDYFKSFSIMTTSWHGVDKMEDPMNEVVRVTSANLTAAGFSAAEISRLTMIGATIYDVHSPLERGDVGCGF